MTSAIADLHQKGMMQQWGATPFLGLVELDNVFVISEGRMAGEGGKGVEYLQ